MKLFIFATSMFYLVSANAALAEPVTLAIGSALTSIGVGAVASAAIAGFLVKATVAIGLSLLFSPDKPTSVSQNSIQTTVTTSGGTEPQKFIVGRYATAGHLVAPPRAYSSNPFHSAKDILVYVVEISNIPGVSLRKVIVNNMISPLGTEDGNFGTRLTKTLKFNSVAQSFIYNAYVRFYDGNQTVADTILTNKFSGGVRPWTDAHVGTGISYAVTSFVLNPSLYRQLPEVVFELDGIPLYDVRKDSTAGGTGTHRFGDRTTYEQTDNPIVIAYNVIRGIEMSSGDIYGGGPDIEASDLPFNNWAAAMNACDVDINGREAYRAGMEIDVVNMEPAEVIEEMLKACNGQISEFGGEFRVQVGAPASAVYTMTDDDIIITDSRELKPFPGLDKTYNYITATYVSPTARWNGSEITPIANTTWESEDQGRRLPLTIGLPTVWDKDQANHIANAFIEDSRRYRVHALTLPPDSFILQPLDTIEWTSTENGYVDKLFEVVTVKDRPRSALQYVVVKERDPADYDFPGAVAADDDVTDEEDAGTVQTVGISSSGRTQIIQEKMTNIITINVTASAPDYLNRVEVEYKKSSDSDYIKLGAGQPGLYEAVDLENVNYDTRARAISLDGYPGDWSYDLAISAGGVPTAPADVTGFTGSIVGGNLSLDWDPSTEAALSYFQIRHSVVATPASDSWANATTVRERVPRPSSGISVPARSGIFHIRAYNKAGLASENYTSVTITNGEIEGFNTSLTQSEHTTFTGSKTDCSVVSDELQITDVASGPSEAEYEFSSVIDTGSSGSPRKVRARVDCEVTRVDKSAGLWDDMPGNWDDFPGLWDDWTGDAQFADTDIEFYISFTDDDPSGSPTWSDWRKFRVGDFTGRAFRFKVKLVSKSNNVTPSIRSLTAFVEYN